MLEPTFSIRDVPVYGDVILAPMAGYSDVPHRGLCRSFGSAMNYTEFVAVEELLGKKRTGPAWQLLDFTPDDRPMVFQIFGNNAELILKAAQRIEELGPDIIDINMGCSTRKVSGRGAGVAMMRTPQLVAQTMRLLTQHLSVPVTAKIRLGWEGEENYLEIGRILQDNGCAAVAIHPRTKEQKYGESADWDAITALKQALSIPVIGNGDIASSADIDRMLDQTGCDAVMIGRAAIGNPWLFARREPSSVTPHELHTTIQFHAAAMDAYYGNRGVVLFRKYLKQYLRHVGVDPVQLSRLLQARTAAERTALLEELLVDPACTSRIFHPLSV